MKGKIVLITGATSGIRRKGSKDGIEETLAVNYLAPFLMTNLLLGLLKKSAPSRIASVASRLHTGTIHFEGHRIQRVVSRREGNMPSQNLR